MKGSPTQGRRDFLKLASIPFIVPSSVFGKNAPSNRINVAMIGLGRQGLRPNLNQFLSSPDAQVVAVCDVDTARLKRAQAQANAYYSEKTGSDYSGVRAYTDFREVLERDDVDAVMISTQDHWHAPMGVLAARAGKKRGGTGHTKRNPPSASLRVGLLIIGCPIKHCATPLNRRYQS